jgi:hypothetical protein
MKRRGAWVYLGMTCPWCKKDHVDKPVLTKRHKRYARTRNAGGVAPAKVHGLATYRNWRCRCGICVEAARGYGREPVARLDEKTTDFINFMYSEYGSSTTKVVISELIAYLTNVSHHSTSVVAASLKEEYQGT